ncbi:YciI family protein [Aquimarina sediminis]|uniref:YciI family protein n=1 Tax=Aquimarina sediminis TaxID=2070536 RepID=UPI000CA03482|nr:YciI family protein [Aquimarina sediminis]
MFVISLKYKVTLDKVEEELDNHISYLKKQYDLGNFHASGRKKPRTGGIILSKVKERKQLDEILEKDPFYIKDIADYEIIEFIPTMTSDDLKCLLE